jgi:hypothetical protein
MVQLAHVVPKMANPEGQLQLEVAEFQTRLFRQMHLLT